MPQGKKYPEEKRQGEKSMAKEYMHKDSPVPPRDKELRKKAAKKKLKKYS